MRLGKPSQRNVYLGWEEADLWQRLRRTGWLLRILGVIAVVALVIVAHRWQGLRSKKMQTRATLQVVADAVDRYQRDHQRCPESFEVLRRRAYLYAEAKDAWGRPLRLLCPGRTRPDRYDLLSDGPDGQVGGEDRMEAY